MINKTQTNPAIKNVNSAPIDPSPFERIALGQGVAGELLINPSPKITAQRGKRKVDESDLEKNLPDTHTVDAQANTQTNAEAEATSDDALVMSDQEVNGQEVNDQETNDQKMSDWLAEENASIEGMGENAADSEMMLAQAKVGTPTATGTHVKTGASPVVTGGGAKAGAASAGAKSAAATKAGADAAAGSSMLGGISTTTAVIAGSATVGVGIAVATSGGGDPAPASPPTSTVPTLVITDNVATTANIASGNVTFTFTFSEAVTGFVTGGIVVTGGAKGTFTAVSGNVYTLVVTPTASTNTGTITVNVAANVATDADGNGNTIATQVTQAYDTAAPTATATITAVADSVGSITGNLSSGGVTDDTSLVLSGTNSTLGTGEVVAVYDGATKLGNATPLTTTTWSYTDSTLANGNAVSYTVRVEDAAGNLGTPSLAFTTTIDTVAPVANNDTGNAVEAGGVNNLTPGSNAIGNVLTGGTADTDASTPLTVVQVAKDATTGVVGNALVGTYGTLTLNSDGSYTYVVNNDNSAVNALAAARNVTPAGTLTDTFTYIARDRTGINSNNATLTVTITGANDAPTASFVSSTETGFTISASDVDTGDTLALKVAVNNASAVTNGGNTTFTVSAQGVALATTISVTDIALAETSPIFNLVQGTVSGDSFSAVTGGALYYGFAGNDTLAGGDGNDITYGGDGDDTLTGNGGADNLNGGNGVDVVTGNAGADTLTGGAEADTLNGGADIDNMDGGAGSDIFLIAAASEHSTGEVITGGADTDEIRFTTTAAETLTLTSTTTTVETVRIINAAGNDATGTNAANVNASAVGGAGLSIFGNEGANILTGTNLADTITGNGGADNLIGNDGTDVLIGGAGIDNISGGAGADTLNGGTEVDIMDGGTENDIYLIAAGDHGAAEITDASGTADEVRFTSTTAQTLTIFAGDTGLEIIKIGDAAGVLTGTTNENINASLAVNGLQIIGNNGANILTGTGFADTITGNAGDDVLIGGAGIDIVDGGAGNDTITGGAGADNLTGGTGADLFVIGAVADFASGETINGTVEQNTTDTLRLDAAGTYSLVGVTNIDSVVLNQVAANFNVTVADAMVSTADFNQDNVGGDLQISAGTAMTNGVVVNAAGLTGINRITVIGTNLGGADSLTGGAGADVIDGGAGNDTITGGAGADNLTGGTGADLFVIGAVADFASGETINGTSEQGTTDTLRLDAAGTYSLTGVTNIDSVVLNQNAANFNVTVADAMVSTADFNQDNVGGDLQISAGTAIASTVTISASTLASPNRITILGANFNGNDSMTGGAGADVIDGGAGNDTITGGAGADNLTGGTGADLFVIGAVADFASGETINGTSEQGTTDTLRLDAAGTYSLTGVTNIDSVVLNHNAAGFNVTVADAMVSTADFNADNVGGDLQISAGTAIASTVTISASTLASPNRITILGANFNGNDSMTGGAGADVIDGGAGTDTINGNDGNDTLTGGAGNDTITGGAGNDIIVGGAGADNITGGLGDDTLTGSTAGDTNGDTDADTFNVDSGIDTITDLNGTTTADILIVNALATALATVTAAFTATSATSNLGTATLTTSGSAVNMVAAGTAGGAAPGQKGYDITNNGAATTLTGSSFNDTLKAGSMGDTLIGGGGEDTLNGGLVADNLDGGTGDDVLTGGGGNDTLTGGDGLDFLKGDDGDDILNGNAGNDVIIGSAGVDSITGGANDDALTGGAGGDTFNVDAGNDTIADLGFVGAEGGTDILKVSAGATVIATVTADFTATSATTNANTYTAAVLNTAGFNVIMAAATDVGGYTINNTSTDTADTTTLTGSGFIDRINGGAGADTINGGGGADILVGNDGADNITGGLGNDALTGSTAGDTDGDAFADTFNVDSGVDTITDLNGSDILVVAAAATSVTATITADFTATNATNNAKTYAAVVLNSDGFNVNMAAAVLGASPEAGGGGYTINNTSGNTLDTTTLTGSGFIDSITGGAGLDTINGGVGNDTIVGGAGADNLFGGENDDTLTGSVAGDTNGDVDVDTFNVDSGIDTITDLNGTTTADILKVSSGATAIATVTAAFTATVNTSNAGIANLTTAGSAVDMSAAGNGMGSNGYTVTNTGTATTLTGSTFADTINGGTGADTLIGGAGVDSLSGGTGNDTYSYASTAEAAAGENIVEATSGGIDTIRTTVAAAGTVDLSALTVNGGVDFQGASQLGIEQILIAASTTATFSGAQLDGNTIAINESAAGTTNLIINVASGVTNSFAGLTFAAFAGAGTEFDDGADTITIYGNTGAEIITGTGIKDTINGDAGNDIINGGAGADVINGDNGDDTITGGAGADSMTGGAGADIFVIGALADFPDGDTINGTAEAGTTDTLRLDAADTYSLVDVTNIDSVVLNQDTAGFSVTVEDAMVSTADFDGNSTLGDLQFSAGVSMANGVVINAAGLTGTNRIVVIGNNLGGADSLTGGAGADVIDGGAGVDTITGGAGNDTITGGTGADALTGGADNDTYVYAAADIAADNIVEDADAAGPILGGIDTIRTTATVNLSALTVNSAADLEGAGTDEGIEQILIAANTTATFIGAQLHLNNISINESAAGTTNLIINVASGATNSFAGLTFAAFTGGDAFDDGVDTITINGAGGNENITGTSIKDTINGDAGNDILNGGAGNDILIGGDAVDDITGGAGNDTFTGSTAGDTNGDASADTFNVDFGTDTITDLNGTGVNADILNITGTATVTATVTAAFTATASTSNTSTTANSATLNTAGFDVDMSLAGGGAGYTINNTAAPALTILTGSDFNDVINGGTGVDTIKGRAGDDALLGGDGADNIEGGSGVDSITGGAGADGINLLEGAAAIDHVIYTSATDGNTLGAIAVAGADSVSNFVAADDTIDIGVSFGNTLVQGGNELASNLLGNVVDAGTDARVNLALNDIFTIQVTNITSLADFADFGKLLGAGNAFDLDNTAGGSDTFKTTAVVAADKAIFLVTDDGGLSGLYLFTAANTNNSVDSNELTLLSIITANAQLTHANITVI